MISDTYAAIVAHFDAAASSTGSALAALAISGGLHADVKPAGTPYPYCVLKQEDGARMLRSYDRKRIERPNVRLRLWGTDADELLTLAEALCTTFDDQRLALDGGGVLQLTRIREPRRHREPGHAENAEAIWTCWIDYELFAQQA